ncbi:MAG TPA: phosphodiester glycosidase family protein [Candidatus Limnocylindrales bacterium]|nr:phosphodiester glycosidase family protein [Candidatus Limnocylindrales bacterium]
MRNKLAVLSLMLPLVVVPASAAPSAAVETLETLPPPVIETDTKTRPVAPGVTLTSFDRIDAAGWLRADALSTDLSAGPNSASVDYLYSGAVSTPEPLSGPAGRAHAVAAVNGDFFDINNSSAAQGIGIQNGQLIQSPVSGHNNAVGITAEGLGKVLSVYFEGTATPEGGTPITLTQFNNLIQANGIGLFTPQWGSYNRARAVEGAAQVTEVTIVDGAVTSVANVAGTGPIPAGTSILLGRDSAAASLAALAVGIRVDIAYRPKAGDGSNLRAAVGGNVVLVRDGVPQPNGDPAMHPRTAVGFSADGRKMFLLTVDGRQADSRGVTLTELGTMMAELGAYHALNLDGGGSSTMLAREPGSDAVQVENQPSDGGERSVPNGLAIFAPAGSGNLRGYWVETAIDPLRAPGLSPVKGGRPDRVFPGLTRKLTAAGYDETYGPAEGTAHWRATPAQHGLVNSQGVFRAFLPGTTTVTAFSEGATGSIQLTALGLLNRLDATSKKVGLAGLDASGTFGVVGYDAEGRSAPIEPGDLKLEYDTSLMSVEPSADGQLKVTAKKAVGAGLITASIGGTKTVIAVTIGLEDIVVANFDDAAQWFYNSIPTNIVGSVAPAEGKVGMGLRLSANFAQHTVTRAAYANPPVFIDVPGQPQAFTMWIHGNGKAEWPSLHLVDANGAAQVLRGPNVTWNGWQQITFNVPQGIAYPVKIRRFYAPEIRAAAQYQSELIIDEIVAKVPPSVNLPVEPNLTDKIVVADGNVDGAPWRFAVMSDSQFVAANPDSDLVRSARRTLREIKAQRPDFLVINGDFVDTAFPADFALAKRILDEELGGELPYYYVPGNHEIMGAPIANFRAVFGDTQRTFDHKGTRFVTLNSADGTLRGGGFDQIARLRQALDGAATDPAVGSVAVLWHIPPRDPEPNKASQLNDRKEAALVEKWLAEFEARSGKEASYIGAHVGTFHASRVDGVPYLINGNSGKAPATPPERGGFLGWTMFGVSPDGLRAEIRPQVDTVAVAAPESVRFGQSGDVTATLTQGGRTVPVALPVSADWTGSANLHIGGLLGIRPWHDAWFDPETGRLTALRRSGTVTLTVTVNEVSSSATVSLAP